MQTRRGRRAAASQECVGQLLKHRQPLPAELLVCSPASIGLPSRPGWQCGGLTKCGQLTTSDHGRSQVRKSAAKWIPRSDQAANGWKTELARCWLNRVHGSISLNLHVQGGGVQTSRHIAGTRDPEGRFTDEWPRTCQH